MHNESPNFILSNVCDDSLLSLRVTASNSNTYYTPDQHRCAYKCIYMHIRTYIRHCINKINIFSNYKFFKLV